MLIFVFLLLFISSKMLLEQQSELLRLIIPSLIIIQREITFFITFIFDIILIYPNRFILIVCIFDSKH
jgi:hypothetical protein